MEKLHGNLQDTQVYEEGMVLSIAKPAVSADGTIAVVGNFDELKAKISSVVEKYKDTVLQEDNVGYVKALHTQFVKLRTGIESKRKEWKSLYITAPGKILDAMCDDLKHIAQTGEEALGRQLDDYDQKRKDELTVILNEYVQEAAKKHELRSEWADKIVLRSCYYNKTQKEEDSADDIELQAEELGKKQKEYDAALALIDAELEGTLLLRDTYVEQLQYRSAMEIVLKIKADKKESMKLYAQMREQEEAGKPITVGSPVSDAVKSAVTSTVTESKGKKVADEKKPGNAQSSRYRERTLWIRYPAECATSITDFFADNGIQYKFV